MVIDKFPIEGSSHFHHLVLPSGDRRVDSASEMKASLKLVSSWMERIPIRHTRSYSLWYWVSKGRCARGK